LFQKLAFLLRLKNRAELSTVKLTVKNATSCCIFTSKNKPHQNIKKILRYYLGLATELQQVEFIYQTFLTTGSYKEALKIMNQHNVVNKSGKPFNSESLKRLLQNTKYIGKVKAKDCNDVERWITLKSGQVISQELFDQVQIKIKSHNEIRLRQNRCGTRIYLLTGLLKYEDDSNFEGLSGTSKTGNRYYYYINRGNNLTVNAIEIEQAVINGFKRVFADNKELEACVILNTLEISSES